MGNQFFAHILEMLDEKLELYVLIAARDLIHYLQPIFTSLCIIYIAMWGISHARGTAGEPIMNGIIRLIKIAMITQLGLTIGVYNTNIAQFFYTAPGELIAAVNGVTPNGEFFDAIAMKGFNLGLISWNEAGVFDGDFGLYIIALVIWGSVVVMLAIAFFYIILSKMALSVLLAIGPLFIIMTLFDATKRFCDAWVGQVVNYVLVGVLATMYVGLFYVFADEYLTKLIDAEESSAQAALSLVIFAIICTGLMFTVMPIATALGGGLAMNVHGVIASFKNTGAALKTFRPQNLKNASQSVKSAAGAPARAYAKMRGNKISKK